jgi:predicted O-methyltransferase YrrM
MIMNDSIGRLDELLDELKQYFGDVLSARKHFALAQKYGLHVTPSHFYYPIPDTSNLPLETWTEPSEMVGVEMCEEDQIGFLENVFSKYTDVFKSFPLKQTNDELEFTFENDQISGADPFVLYALIRHLKPAHVIEVGAGYSTLVTTRALRENRCGRITCIEPYPRSFLKRAVEGVGEILSVPVQDIDFSVFEALCENDVLFIDSSHVVRIGGDVNQLFLEILPRLRPGVWIHIHDVFFPHDYPEEWTKQMNFFWSEQYLLHSFLCCNSEFKVRFAVGYMGKKYTRSMQKVFPGYQIGMGGGSCWIQRVC